MALSVGLALAACARPNGSSGSAKGSASAVKMGGQDGGGGHVKLSSKEEVRKALDVALGLARQTNILNVYSAFAFDYVSNFTNAQGPDMSSTDGEIDMTGEKAIPLDPKKIKDPVLFGSYKIWKGRELKCYRFISFDPKECYSGTATDNSESPHLNELLSKSRIEFRERGDCGRAQDQHADASVSRFGAGAKVCFSLENLQRLPPSSLVREIMGLVYHEIAHLHGYGEEDAQLLQAAFLTYFANRFGEISRESVNRRTAVAMSALSQNWFLIDQTYDDYRDPIVYMALGRIFDTASALPYWADSTALQLTLGLSDRSAIVAYTNSVSNLISELWLFQLATPGSPHRGRIPKSNEEMKQLLIRVGKLLRAINENWKFLSYGWGAPVCLDRTDIIPATGLVDTISSMPDNTLPIMYGAWSCTSAGLPAQNLDSLKEHFSKRFNREKRP